MTAPIRHSLRWRMAVAFAVVGVLVAAIVAIAVFAVVRLVSASDEQVNRWDPSASITRDLMAALVNQETGVRGFAAGRTDTYLQPYRDGQTQQAADVVLLRKYFAGHDDLNGQLDTMLADADTWRRLTAEPTIAGARQQPPVARDPAEAASDVQRFDRVRADYSTLLNDVLATRRASRGRLHDATLTLIATLAAAGLLIVVVGLAAWRGLRRFVIAPITRLGHETQVVARGVIDHRIEVTGPAEFGTLAADVESMRGQLVDQLAELADAHADLVRRGEELARSNADLEQFAYVASHDLQEPLRKVSNFCQLLERQYVDQLDDRARQYIGFATDGARRMQVLIRDLLEFSRVGRTTEGFTEVDLAAIAAESLRNQRRLADDATVEIGELPTVRGDQRLLTTLFDNLLGNALKYRSETPQHVAVSASRTADGVTVSVEDNGIGIDPQYAERIFVIFQRLHLRDQYDGTGIGLALCKKIVEFHGGRIWLDPAPRERGSRFCFTLPTGDLRATP